MTPDEIESAFESVDRSGPNESFWRMLLWIGDEEKPLREWEPRVRTLLDHEDPTVVAEAIEILAIRWKVSDLIDECMALAMHQESEISEAAVNGMASLAFRSGDYEVASLLMEILEDHDRPLRERRIAVQAIPRILEEDRNDSDLLAVALQLPRSGVSSEEFSDLVPWDSLKRIMDRHRPKRS